MHLSRQIGLLILGTACSACVPYPHTVQMAPAMDGTVERDGAPVAGATILLAYDRPPGECADAVPVGTTLHDGSFHLARRTETRWLYEPFKAPLQAGHYTVCVQASGQVMMGSTGMVRRDTSETLTLACDLAHPRWLKASDGSGHAHTCQAPASAQTPGI